MNVHPSEQRHIVKVGDHVRSFDHMPMEDRPLMYIEGIVKKVEGEKIIIHVFKDTVFDIGVRLEVVTYDFTFMGEYKERIQILGSLDTDTGVYTRSDHF